MKRILIIVLPALLMACSPCRRLTTVTQDSVRIETLVCTEYVPDTVFLEVPVERERRTVRDTASHLETSFARSDARIGRDGVLFHSLENKPQRRPVRTAREIVFRDSIVYRDREASVEKIVAVERRLTGWQQVRLRGFWVLLALLVFLFRKNILGLARRLL